MIDVKKGTLIYGDAQGNSEKMHVGKYFNDAWDQTLENKINSSVHTLGYWHLWSNRSDLHLWAHQRIDQSLLVV